MAALYRTCRCALLLALLFLSLLAPGQAQPGTISGTIVDVKNLPVAGAQIVGSGGQVLGTTADDGSFTVPAGSGRVQIVSVHFEPTTVNLDGPSPVHVLLEHPLESVTVTAYRAPLASGDSPASTRILTGQRLREAAGISLYKERRRETENRIADTRENLARVSDHVVVSKNVAVFIDDET